jgi:hypothetical protein
MQYLLELVLMDGTGQQRELFRVGNLQVVSPTMVIHNRPHYIIIVIFS